MPNSLMPFATTARLFLALSVNSDRHSQRSRSTEQIYLRIPETKGVFENEETDLGTVDVLQYQKHKLMQWKLRYLISQKMKRAGS